MNNIFDSVETGIEKGINLIEASAGTGKTYTIAMLVLRAITENEIDIERILIVTFTKAAAKELSARVRARLVEAKQLLEKGIDNVKCDPTLSRWGATALGDEKLRLKYIRLLQLAIVDIDRASIFTIHSFCQRMLGDLALESGQLFDLELTADLSVIKTEAVRDFWRTNVYGLPAWQCSIIIAQWSDPQKLLPCLVNVQNKNIAPNTKNLDALWLDLQKLKESLQDWWSMGREALLASLHTRVDASMFKKDFSQAYRDWWQEWDDFFTGRREAFPENISWLTNAGLIDELNGQKFRGKKSAEKMPYIEELCLPTSVAEEITLNLKELYIAFRIEFNKQVAVKINDSLIAGGLLSFDELITRLNSSLKQSETKDLVNLLQDRFELALIDEFQDTDNDQWQIFSSLFGTKKHSLYLIGDPKQAIYKFRGADIHTYFSARKKANNIYSLDKNYRSHPDLLSAVNNLFLHGDDPFLFKDQGLDYQEIASGASTEKYFKHPDHDAKLFYCQLEDEPKDKKGIWTSGKAKIAVSQHVLAEIVSLLSGSGADDKAAHIYNEGVAQRVAPKDIAILVRGNLDALEYQQALISLGIPAIITGRDSIFKGEECRELIALLDAIANHDNVSKLKTALSLSLFSLTGNELVELWERERDVAEIYDLFLHCYNLWVERGVLPMLYHLVEKKEMFLKLATKPRAERKIANFAHLFELVQQAETVDKLGIRQTLIWLTNAHQSSGDIDSCELRLESDEEALKIVTVHSSKGLQYPIVFCPDLFLRSGRLKNEKLVVSCQDDEHIIDFGSDDFDRRKDIALNEELAEYLRCAYVAMTRAELACYVYWADVKASGKGVSSQLSPLAHLLFPSDKPANMTDDIDAGLDMSAEIVKLASGFGCAYLSVSPETLCEPVDIAPDKVDGYEVLSAGSRSLRTDWQLTSYSALAGLSDYATLPVLNDENITKNKDVPIISANLPKGARFGNAVHDVFEFFDFEALAEATSIEDVLGIKKICNKYGLGLSDEEYGIFFNLIQDSVNTQLSSRGGPSLKDIPAARCLKEMEFCLRLAHINVDSINDILAGEKTVQRLSEKHIRGFMTGFVDLLFSWDGKYYILDYKSNYLGDKVSDYRDQSLVNAMAGHNYGLQYYIYSLVLHQHLKTFVEDYEYERHFGGVFYLFVRGMAPDISGSGVFYDLPAKETIMALDELIGGEE